MSGHRHDEPRHHPHPDPGPPAGDLPRGAGSDKLLFLDAFSGIAGDMLVAALVDLGVPRAAIDEALDALPLEGYGVELGSVTRSGIVGRCFRVHVEGAHPERSYGEIRAMLESAALDDGVKRRALDAFAVLARAEASVHRVPLDAVHFHEVGAVDSIVDIVAAAAALAWIAAPVVASPLPMGHGTVKARHGVLPLPAPATVACLRGVPTYDGGIEAELVTPTGACLVAACAREFARWPALRPERVGWGAGSRDLVDRPNLLRVVLGRPNASAADAPSGAAHLVLECNLDDSTAEIAAHALERALAAGALDAWVTPIVMKKGRPAMLLAALAAQDGADRVVSTLLSETSSLGVRLRPVHRVERPRRMLQVDTPYGRVAVKVADGDGLPLNLAPEFEHCREAALRHDVPVKAVLAAAVSAAQRALGEAPPATSPAGS